MEGGCSCIDDHALVRGDQAGAGLSDKVLLVVFPRFPLSKDKFLGLRLQESSSSMGPFDQTCGFQEG